MDKISKNAELVAGRFYYDVVKVYFGVEHEALIVLQNWETRRWAFWKGGGGTTIVVDGQI